jgi:hypothetical protein
MTNWIHDVESRGKVGFNTGILKTHADAEAYARRKYLSHLERNVFVSGWNMAFWDEQSSARKRA